MAAPGRTVAVLNTSVVPTAAMVTGRVPVPGHADAVARVASATRAQHCVDAHALSEELFGDHMPANLLLLGAAYQHGCLPVGADAIERAITLNRASVEQNLAAFRWGRAVAHDPDAVRRAVLPAPPEPPTFEEVVADRVADLTGYQNATYARTYADDVRGVAARALERAGEEAGAAIALAYARGLHKLMAYKDEYEVARLHLDPAEQARREREFGTGAKVTVLLHPPVLRAMGMKRKIKVGRSAGVLFRGLRAAKVLRGDRVRRVRQGRGAPGRAGAGRRVPRARPHRARPPHPPPTPPSSRNSRACPT
ncbi:hypothetical protein GCM10020001_074660 [Nonomuraea salmonea]